MVRDDKGKYESGIEKRWKTKVGVGKSELSKQARGGKKKLAK